MPTQIQLRRGTTSEHSSFTGAAGEVTVDTTKKTLVVHDGSTAGGIPVAKENNATLTGSIGLPGTSTFNSTGLGVGTGSPANPLHVVRDNTAARGQLSLQTVTGSNFAQITFYDQTTLSAQIYQGYGTDKSLIIQNPLAHGIIFNANGSEVIRLTSSGNVGINQTSPAAKLDVLALASTVGLKVRGGGNTGINILDIADAGGFGPLVLNASGNLGIGTSSPVCKLNVRGAGDQVRYEVATATDARHEYFRNGSREAYINWDANLFAIAATQASGVLTFAAGGTTERARITSAGELLVGKNAADNTTAGSRIATSYMSTAGTQDYWLAYNTSAAAYRFYVSAAGTISATSTTISAISDQRLKENIQDLDVGLDKIMALKPRKFDWKSGKGKDIQGDRGFIAQEFEQVFPDMIDEWKDPAPEGEEPYKAVRADLIPVLVKAIQELKAEFDAYKATHP